MRRCCLKIFSILGSGGHFVQRSRTDFNSFGKGSPKKHFCEIILISNHWCRRKCHLKVFLFLDLVAILFRATEPSRTFGRGSPKEHFCEIILKSVHWPARLIYNVVSRFFSVLTSGGNFVQQSRTI